MDLTRDLGVMAVVLCAVISVLLDMGIGELNQTRAAERGHGGNCGGET